MRSCACPVRRMQRVLRGYGMKSRSAVFPTGLEDSFFLADDSRAREIRQKYGKGKKHLLITVSRLEREKNYGFLLRGIADIRQRIGDDFHVLILGDGSQKSELKVRTSLLESRIWSHLQAMSRTEKSGIIWRSRYLLVCVHIRDPGDRAGRSICGRDSGGCRARGRDGRYHRKRSERISHRGGGNRVGRTA